MFILLSFMFSKAFIVDVLWSKWLPSLVAVELSSLDELHSMSTADWLPWAP